jgi:hypothetical protein
MEEERSEARSFGNLKMFRIPCRLGRQNNPGKFRESDVRLGISGGRWELGKINE